MFAAADLAHLLVDEFSRLRGGRLAGAFILAGFLYRASLWHGQSPWLVHSSAGSQQTLTKAMARQNLTPYVRDRSPKVSSSCAAGPFLPDPASPVLPAARTAP